MPVKTALLSVSDKTGICELAKSLHDLGVNADSFTGSQAGFLTDTNHQNAKMSSGRCARDFCTHSAQKLSRI